MPVDAFRFAQDTIFVQRTWLTKSKSHAIAGDGLKICAYCIEIE